MERTNTKLLVNTLYRYGITCDECFSHSLMLTEVQRQGFNNRKTRGEMHFTLSKLQLYQKEKKKNRKKLYKVDKKFKFSPI